MKSLHGTLKLVLWQMGPVKTSVRSKVKEEVFYYWRIDQGTVSGRLGASDPLTKKTVCVC